MKIPRLNKEMFADLLSSMQNVRPRPMRDWIIILSFAVVLFLASLVSTVFYFYTSTTSASYTSAVGALAPAPTSVEKAQALFVERETTLKGLLQYPFVDPGVE